MRGLSDLDPDLDPVLPHMMILRATKEGDKSKK